MSSTKLASDVFVSHSPGDARLALQIAEACRANGLTVFLDSMPPAGEDVSDAVWEALAESRAMIMVLSSAEPTASMGIELGAARAWDKPVFGIVSDSSAGQRPPWLTGVNLYPAGRLDEVIRAIKLTGQELSDDDRSLLVKLHDEDGTSVDQLVLEPTLLHQLLGRFVSKTGKTIVGERLLSELLRLRKQGRLQRHAPRDGSRSRKGTA